MHYDFIEIGTSDFDTLIELATDKTRGLSIEPLEFYLNNLPSKPLVTKVNCAISNYCGEINLFYVDPEDIKNHSLGIQTRGCNSVNEPHRAHKEYAEMGLSHIVKQKKVEVINWKELIKRYGIESVDLLKIDAEGHDSVILKDLFDESVYRIFPKTIIFEANGLTKGEEVENVLSRAKSFGYTFRYGGGSYKAEKNIILRRKKN